MRCNKVSFDGRTKAEYDEDYSGELLDLSDIKTVYAGEHYSWPAPVEDFTEDWEDGIFISEEDYLDAIADSECNRGFLGLVVGVEMKSGEFYDFREDPLRISIETPTDTIVLLDDSASTIDELIAKMDEDRRANLAIDDLSQDEPQL